MDAKKTLLLCALSFLCIGREHSVKNEKNPLSIQIMLEFSFEYHSSENK